MYANFLEEYKLLTINADPYLGTNDWTPNIMGRGLTFIIFEKKYASNGK